ncbi:MAG TPA: DUF2232 domain-containing protein [Spirochaetota bacterium]|nr:DUF2232 domain-containing protein [Spirochaetota bacterium]HQO22123.1 DUF2232 domain-containing protein [Spirochaetota bacterium]HQQ23933.1 DUF2232 domain-containing protein [Spirochaetota bacterium]
MIATAVSVFKMGKYSALWLLPLSVLMIYFSIGYIDILVINLSALAIGSITGFAYRSKRSVQFIVLTSVFLVFGIFAADYLYETNYMGASLANEAKTAVQSFLDSGRIDDKQKAEFAEQYKFVMEIMKDLVPFMIFVSALMISFAGFSILDLIFKRILKAENSIKGIENFKVNEWLVFVVIFSIALIVFDKEGNFYPAKTVGKNILLVMTVVYFIQSLGILKFVLMKKRIPVFIMPLFLLGMAIFSFQVFGFVVMFLAGIGLLDIWADFRKFSPESIKSDKKEN